MLSDLLCCLGAPDIRRVLQPPRQNADVVHAVETVPVFLTSVGVQQHIHRAVVSTYLQEKLSVKCYNLLDDGYWLSSVVQIAVKCS